MRQISLIIFGVLLTGIIGGPPRTPPNAPADQRFQITQGDFARDIYFYLAKNTDGNIIFSPFSIGLTLAMAYIGSEGNTEAEFRDVMHFHCNKSFTRDSFSQDLAKLKEPIADIDLKIMNAMYVDDSLDVLDEYSNQLSIKFDSAPQIVDFEQTEEARQLINGAVSNVTNEKIEELIPEGTLDPNVAMILVNAMYFNGLWENEFLPQSTSPSSFWISKEQSVEVQMMNMKATFEYSHSSRMETTLVVLPYKGGRLSMAIFLPDARDGLPQFEARFRDQFFWQNARFNPSKSYAQISLPKFKFEHETNLTNVLKSLGINEAFQPGVANFEKITGQRNIHVSDARHKAFIEVTEKGTEAAAATQMDFKLSSGLTPPDFKHIKVDHPFMFIIADIKTGHYLFTGRVTNPNDQ